MNKKQVTKKAYFAPYIEVCLIKIENLTQSASGQHEPIGQGGGSGDAKRFDFLFEEEEQEDTPSRLNPWKD